MWIGFGLVLIIGQAVIIRWMLRTTPSIGKFTEVLARHEASNQRLIASNEQLVHELKIARQHIPALTNDEQVSAQLVERILNHRETA